MTEFAPPVKTALWSVEFTDLSDAPDRVRVAARQVEAHTAFEAVQIAFPSAAFADCKVSIIKPKGTK